MHNGENWIICSLIFLPHFIASKKEQAQHVTTSVSWIDKVASYRPEYNKYIVIVILLLTIVFAYTSRYVGFESDMMRMNFMSDKLTKAEADLNAINQSAAKSVYLVTEGTTLNDALINNEKLVASVEQLKEKNIVRIFLLCFHHHGLYRLCLYA